jgi:hypothetical protein
LAIFDDPISVISPNRCFPAAASTLLLSDFTSVKREDKMGFT